MNTQFTEGENHDSDLLSPNVQMNESNESNDNIADNDYQNTNSEIPPEIQNLFNYISLYKPPETNLECRLKPFILDYMPAVGFPDNFLKVNRPDGKKNILGLTILDEPAIFQSDPAALTLELEQHFKIIKNTTHDSAKRYLIDNAHKNPKKIQAWISKVEELHKKRPPPNMKYSIKIPNYDDLLERFPESFSEVLRQTPLPNDDIKMDIEEWIKVVCGILDIPFYPDKLLESLYLIFDLYLEISNDIPNDIYLPTLDSALPQMKKI